MPSCLLPDGTPGLQGRRFWNLVPVDVNMIFSTPAEKDLQPLGLWPLFAYHFLSSVFLSPIVYPVTTGESGFLYSKETGWF